MSGDLMHKGITELTPVVAGTLTEDDLIPVYQRRTLTVNKITVKDFIAEIIRLSGCLSVSVEEKPAKKTTRTKKKKEEE